MRKALMLGVLFILGIVTFLITTAIVDVACRYSGYYQAGIDEERELFGG